MKAKNQRVRKQVWGVAAALVVCGVAAQAGANVGAWTNAGTIGTCHEGESRITADSAGVNRWLWAASTAEGTEVISQSNTNCTTESASYGNSKVQDCRVNMTRHRCISVP